MRRGKVGRVGRAGSWKLDRRAFHGVGRELKKCPGLELDSSFSPYFSTKCSLYYTRMKTTLMVMGKWINMCHKELISVSHNVTMSQNVTGNEHHRKETSCSPDGHPLSEGISTNTTGKQMKIFHSKATSSNPKCGVLPAPASYHPRQAEPISKRPTWVIGSQVRPDPQKIVTS